MNLSVVIVTLGRPASLGQCVASLASETHIQEVIVVDQSPELAPLPPTHAFELRHVHVPSLAGQMTAARNYGLRLAGGDIVAFLDDDVTVRPGWADALLAAFRDNNAVAVAGRVFDVGQPVASGPVGRIDRGRITGNFSADSVGYQAIQHGLGASMSFERQTLVALGGFRAIFPGTALREDTDVFLRIGRKGPMVFAPLASVDHHGAPHVVGQRFDRRYMWWAKHNHMLLMLGNRELRRHIVSWLIADLIRTARTRGSLPRRAFRVVLACAASVHGVASACALAVRGQLREVGPLAR